MDIINPTPGFHFVVSFINPLLATPIDMAFQSVTGLEVSINTETLAEGGENRFTHSLPGRQSYANLVLKRGMRPMPSPLTNWCLDALINFNIQPADLLVNLLGPEHVPLRTWNVIGAYPVKWSVSEFNAEQNQLAIETLELKYRYFKPLLPPLLSVDIPIELDGSIGF
ncbi:MAG: phage tail protein [Lewinellaceae bacterium]|nr:phage tail protein [Saprospiraceae bacterium]MCB9333131.1 phage tail protein [Lewinellaceae bacterium]